MEIQTGDPVILVNVKGLDDPELTYKMRGDCASIVSIEGDKTYIFFLPLGQYKVFTLDAQRFEIDLDELRIREEDLMRDEMLKNVHMKEDDTLDA